MLTAFSSARRKWIVCLSVICGGILIDRLTKWLAAEFLSPVGSVPLWRGVLHLTYVENRGAAFGMLSGRRWIFMTVSVIGIALFSAYLIFQKKLSVLTCVSLSLVISGGIGNMIDRIALGYVVDFIDFALIDFAVFNGADSFVCVGAALLILSLILEYTAERRAQKQRDKGEEQ